MHNQWKSMASSNTHGCHPEEWVIRIRQSLLEEIDSDKEEGEDYENIMGSIASVPKFLQSSNPESYLPHLIAIGPYHHSRAELGDIAQLKLFAAKKTQKQLNGIKLQQIVVEFIRAEQKIRSHYHRHINLNAEILAWMMAVDACFLLQFLQVYAFKNAKALKGLSPFISRKKSSHNSVLRDILMLENQIPLFLLSKILAFGCTSEEEADEFLTKMLKSFIIEISPLKMTEENLPHCFDPKNSSHLLEVLYFFLVPETNQLLETDEVEEEDEEISSIDQTLNVFNHVKQAIVSWTGELLLKLSFRILTTLPGFIILRQSLEYFSQGENTTTNCAIKKKLLLEEIAIPSATELVSAGIRFLPTNQQLSAITFNVKNGTLQLPTISIDANTGVILRNLVAYETAIVSGPPVFSRYIELMNGIIDMAEDAKVLRRNGVILNRLKSDADVAELWNGMSTSARLTKVQFLDKVIGDVNVYYNRSWRVNVRRLVRRYVLGSWQFLVFVAAVLLLLLVSLQAFCLMFGCTHRINVRRGQIKAEYTN